MRLQLPHARIARLRVRRALRMHHRGCGRPGDDTGRRQPQHQAPGVTAGRHTVPARWPRRHADRSRTPAVRSGRAVLRVLSDAMMEIDTQASPRSRLTVRSVSTLATRWLIPKLPEFNQQIPNVRVVLQPYAPDDDFLDTQTDCWIVPRPPKGNPWPRHVMATYLAGQHIVPICHPDLAPQILKPEDLLRHPLLYHLEQPDDWRIWLETQSGMQSFSVDSGFSTVAGIIDAVADNFGVGIVPRCLLDADLKTQRGLALPAPGALSRRLLFLHALARRRSGPGRVLAMAATPRAAGSERLLTPGPAAVKAPTPALPPGCVRSCPRSGGRRTHSHGLARSGSAM